VIYRPHIDGIRAFSILAVLLFHAGFKSFSGGFIGVDVFLVISGYLITYISLEEVHQGTFSFRRFYEKRLRRLFPALIFILLLSSILSYRFLMPYELKSYFQSLILTVLFSSNIYFYLKTGYFDGENEIKPLLHTWSLSLEEQFYFILPVLVLMFARKKYFPHLLGLLVLISFGLIAKPSAQNSAHFYLLHARAWELLVGSILAYFHFKNSRPRLTSQLSSLMGLIAIVTSFCCFDVKTPHPSYLTLIPVLGTLLLLNNKEDHSINRLISSRYFVGVGLISYSLYLIHQPIFVFLRLFFGRALSDGEASFGIFASLIIAYGMWRFVEQPFRRITFAKNRKIFLGIGLCFAALLGFGFLGNRNGGFINREFAGRPSGFFQVFAQDEVMKKVRGLCESAADLCEIYHGRDGARKVLLIGDSHSLDFITEFDRYAREMKFNAYFSFVGGCSFVIPSLDDNCNKNKSNFLKAIELKLVDEIIYVESFEEYSSSDPEKGVAELTAIIKRVKDQKIRLTIFTPRPTYFNPISYWGASPNINLNSDFKKKPRASVWDNFYKGEYKDFFYNQRKRLCDLSVLPSCTPIEKTTHLPLYKDVNHLTMYGAYLVFVDFLKRGD
jgi:peptidoglycan/LPS O-acetylase OafA/YrhL